MQKTKRILLVKNRSKSPLPDLRNGNSVTPTNSPISQVHQFLAMHSMESDRRNSIEKNQRKTGLAFERSSSMKSEQERYYQGRIRELEDQVQKYKFYIIQYQKLAQKNKKLQQQMSFILNQLENRYLQNEQWQQQSQRKFQTLNSQNKYHMATLQSSAQQNSIQTKLQGQSPRNADSNAQKDEKIEQLYLYVEKLEMTIQKMLHQMKQIQIEIKKNVKKDLNEMEQRLMNYIFGLEERVSQATFRNNETIKKLSSARGQDNQLLQSSKMSRFSAPKANESFMQQKSLFKLSVTERKSGIENQESLVSLRNLEVNNNYSQKSQSKLRQNTPVSQVKRQRILLNKCQNCSHYLQNIDKLTCKLLEKQLQINKLKEQVEAIEIKRHNSNKNSKKLFEYSESKIKKQIYRQENEQQILRQIKQQYGQNSLSVKEKDKKYSRKNTGQSNINIFLDSSSDDQNERGNKQQSQKISIAVQNIQKSASFQADNLLKLQKLKNQLVGVMQQLQKIIHECEFQQKNIPLIDLSSKIKNQTAYISELEQQISRLQMEIEQSRQGKEKLQRLMKMQVREEEYAQVESPYFRPLNQPISCVDHEATKNKIDHILNSIKSFQYQLQEKIKITD